MKRQMARVAVGAALVFGAMSGLAQAASAQVVPASITIHHRLCGDNYLGGDPFIECHDVLVGTALDFTIDGPITETAAAGLATGNVTFEGLPAGIYDVTGGVPGDFSDAEVYCTDLTTGEAVALLATANGVDVTVEEDSEIVCDWYEFPEDLSGNGDDAPGLPNTGAGAGAVAAAGMTGAALLLLPALLSGGLALRVRRAIR